MGCAAVFEPLSLYHPGTICLHSQTILQTQEMLYLEACTYPTCQNQCHSNRMHIGCKLFHRLSGRMSCYTIPCLPQTMSQGKSVVVVEVHAFSAFVFQVQLLQKVRVTTPMWLEQESTLLGPMKPSYKLSSCRKACVEFPDRTSSVE